MTTDIKFRGDSEYWVDWAIRNQQNPEVNPLVSNEDIPESIMRGNSFVGLQEVLAKKIPTRIPRLPWGSQKALIVNLISSDKELREAVEEVTETERLLSGAGIDTTVINAKESDDPKLLRAKLAANHWDIIHFCGHLTVKNDQFIGHAGGMTAAQFVASCCRAAPPRLVILNACRSGDLSTQTDVAGISGPIAQQFCIRGVDAVVATRWDIWDVAAKDFSKGFWTNITHNLDPFTIEDEISLDVKSAILFARKGLKTLHKEKDACWLAYTLFESRNDGCRILSQNIIVPAMMIPENHPPYIDIQNHTKICEHLSPGGAGLYLMSAPACTGKTSISKLALRTLGLNDEWLDFCYNSMRHDHKLEVVDEIFEQLQGLEEAPLLPLIIDDAEILFNHIGSGVQKKLQDISKMIPLLLIMRVRPEHKGMHMLPFKQIGFDPDELIPLQPHSITPPGLSSYLLHHFGIELDSADAFNLCIRMNGSPYNLPRLWSTRRKVRPNLDMLEFPQNAPLLNRLATISDEEVLAIQMISSLITPIACKLRCALAWDNLYKEGVVKTEWGVFESLCSLDILQDWFDIDNFPKENEVEEVLSKVPKFLTDIPVPEKDREFLRTIGHRESVITTNLLFLKLFTGYTLNNGLVEEIGEWDEHPSLGLALRIAMNSLRVIDPEEKMPHLKDGYQEPEMEIKINRPIESEKEAFDSEALYALLRSGMDQKDNTLDIELGKWFSRPNDLMRAINGGRDLILDEFRCRVPSLSITTCKKLGEFIDAHSEQFQPNDLASASLNYQLWMRGANISNDEIWTSDVWIRRSNQSRERVLNQNPEVEQIFKMRELKEKAHNLLLYKTYSERELELLIASKEALSFESEFRHELMNLHYDFGQILLRHLLYEYKEYAFQSFCCHVEKLHEQFSRKQHKSYDDSERMQNFESRYQFFRLSQSLLSQRRDLEKKSDAKSELSWIRDLMETAFQMGQFKFNSDLRKALMSEAASRTIALQRRTEIDWSPLDYRIRARFLRVFREKFWQDTERLPKWLMEELSPHLIMSFDPKFPLPPKISRTVPKDLWHRATEELWVEMISVVFNQMINPPVDECPNFTHILMHESASNKEMDGYLGPQSALCVSRVAALMWRGTRDMGNLAKPFAQIATTYPELLSKEERSQAEKFGAPPSHS